MTMRQVFADTVQDVMRTDPRVAVVLAEISRDAFAPSDRVINVGIREQAMVGVGSGLALSGLRPVLHTYAPFLVERPFEQIKLDFGHQDVGGVLVSVGASYDDPALGRTHQAPGDVALLDTLPGWVVHVPGHRDEVGPIVRAALARRDRTYIRLSLRENAGPHPVVEGFTEVRSGRRGVVLAVGPVLTAVLEATAGMDLRVLYATTIRPFDARGLRAGLGDTGDVLLVEPYLEGTSSHLVAEALVDLPHRLRALGVRREAELRAYGTAEDHDSAHELDVVGIATAARGHFRL
ncbi:transketolase family protein [Saccharothrix coeruleofusca]|uniref:Transketolase n=1 Tax=Saccharothrix coeruleofusca TaxID=33919 RepID=A0A918AK92_9PSEU|nr:transketolase [Saccharothrix coeruleofusca]MBP2338309.1 transketolase [Saccharothrix coeruleofusca]GGP49233.1 transketolase [Saccharothrix coeruleofusca]